MRQEPVKAKKELGQHFLKDEQIAADIVYKIAIFLCPVFFCCLFGKGYSIILCSYIQAKNDQYKRN